MTLFKNNNYPGAQKQHKLVGSCRYLCRITIISGSLAFRSIALNRPWAVQFYTTWSVSVPHQGSSTGIEKKIMYREVFSKSIFLFHNAQCRNLTEFMLDGTVYGLHVALLPYMTSCEFTALV
eukprot:COSAG02_NODE_538_length_20609_cov_7.009703_1_plen_122_part_00